MTKIDEQYPNLCADLAAFFYDREDDYEQAIKQLIENSSHQHLKLLYQELCLAQKETEKRAKKLTKRANIETNTTRWLEDFYQLIKGALMHNDIKASLACMDLTSLNDNDTIKDIYALCDKVSTDIGEVAAVCVYPEFVWAAKTYLQQQGLTSVKVATVTNFPHGGDDLDIALRETSLALGAGADEVDLVFPYRAWLNGNKNIGIQMVSECKKLCQDHSSKLKVIIETGVLKDSAVIKEVSSACIQSGADFIKTSTGKVDVNATLEAAEIMLTAIKEAGAQETCGFKAAGGVRTADEAASYLKLARDIMGDSWVKPNNFRFGASGLLSNLLSAYHGKEETQHKNY